MAHEIILNDSFLKPKEINFCNKIGCKGRSDLFDLQKKSHILVMRNSVTLLIEKLWTLCYNVTLMKIK